MAPVRVRDGLIELRKDDKDARTKRAVLTRSGKARLRKALVLWNAANRRVEAVLGPAAAATLRRLADDVWRMRSPRTNFSLITSLGRAFLPLRMMINRRVHFRRNTIIGL